MCLKRFYHKKIVLCVNAHHLIAGVWLGGKNQSSQVFGNDQHSQALFAKFLREKTAATFSLIIDIAEEDYQLQYLPHTGGRTKTALVTRKLDQFCRGLVYRAASFYGSAQNQVHNDCYLFTAIRNDKNLQPWVALLEAAEIKLSGVYLLSTLSEVMQRQHKQAMENVLLCERLSSGLRQTFFANGRLQMSRLLPDIAENLALNFYQAETEKARLYLVSQRLIEMESPLHLVLFNINHNASQQDQLQNPLNNPVKNIASLSHISLSSVTKSLKLLVTKVALTPELLHMQLLVNGAKVANLAPPALTEKYRVDRLKRQLKWMGVLLLAVSVSVSACWYQQGLQHAAESAVLAHQLKVTAQLYQQERRQSSDLDMDIQKVKAIVERAEQISALPTSPWQVMQVLSSGFAIFSDEDLQSIQLKTLDWSLKLANENQQHQYNLNAWHETALVELEMTGEADRLLQRYLEKLRSHPNVMLVETLPTALDAEKQLQWHGSTAIDQEKTPQKFKLKLILNANPKAMLAKAADGQL